jgi:hypothetical protein
MMQHIPEVSVMRNDRRPETWTVIAVNSDGEGGIDETTFSGPGAKARAESYAREYYECLEPEILA